MKKLYETTVTSVGGREGTVSSPDNTFQMKMASPGADTRGATNPEQLFAAGYSACFNSALESVMARQRIHAPTTVSVAVALYSDGPHNYFLGVSIEGHIEGLDAEKAEALLQEAHTVCPYSKAVHGNIDVTVKLV